MIVEIFTVDSRSIRTDVTSEALDLMETNIKRRSGIAVVTVIAKGLKPHSVIIACAHIVRIDIIK